MLCTTAKAESFPYFLGFSLLHRNFREIRWSVSCNVTVNCSLAFDTNFLLKFEIQEAARMNSIHRKYYGIRGTDKINIPFTAPLFGQPSLSQHQSCLPPVDKRGSAAWQLGSPCVPGPLLSEPLTSRLGQLRSLLQVKPTCGARFSEQITKTPSDSSQSKAMHPRGSFFN